MKKQLALGLVLMTPILAYAATPEGLPTTTGEVADILTRITNWLFTGLLIFSVIMLIVAAYKYLFSEGSEEKVGSARNTIVYAVIALAVGMLAKGIPYLVGNLLKVN